MGGDDRLATAPETTELAPAAGDNARQRHVLAVRSPDGTADVGRRNTVTALAFSPDGTRLAGRTSQTARIWDATTGEQQQKMIYAGTSVLTVAFSPDGTWLTTGASDGTVRIWELATS